MIMSGKPPYLCALLLTIALVLQGEALGADRFEEHPILYSKSPADNPISRLQNQLDSGQATLTWDKQSGWLKSLMDTLKIPASSQVLVFSKTSFQRDLIFPEKPRAIYFNDDVYLGWVQNGSVVEVSVADPQLGTVFYSLAQRPDKKPAFTRHSDSCLQCHASTLTEGVPGHIVRSVFTDKDGQAILRAGTFRTDHSSPLSERWGGWYVTGTHGSQRHMGNSIAEENEDDIHINKDARANISSLKKMINTRPYLGDHSDIVALMVLEHQTMIHNLITRASFETRQALHDQSMMDEILERESGALSPVTLRRIHSAGDRLLISLLFADEEPLSDTITGSSNFTKEFISQGIKDSKGRSLNELDLEKRLFKYPCSYLIYSESFNALPEVVRDYVLERLYEVVTGEDDSDDWLHISNADGNAIREILQETLPNLPDCWGKVN
jgi:hypothetical protein